MQSAAFVRYSSRARIEAPVDAPAVCGFVDQSHIAKLFAGIERSTPGRWRKASR